MKNIEKVVIRYSKHTNRDMIGRTVMCLSPGTKKSGEIKHDLNIFFASEGLPHNTAIFEENI